MAIYSLHHESIGKGTQDRPYTAAAHIRYIARRRACSLLIGERMPAKAAAAQSWLRQQEADDRKNARICDKILLALPRELNAQQRAALVRSFAEAVTKGRASWLAAFHDRGNDRHNPHCHLVIRDRDPVDGKRVSMMSERGSTERLRLLWEEHANRALSVAGRGERIDRRTLQAQGVERLPTIHEGLSSREMVAKGRRIRSRPVNVRNGPGARARERVVDYGRFDQGRSRPAYNSHLRETQSDYWAAIDADRIARQWATEDRQRTEGTAMAKKERGLLGRLEEASRNFLNDPDKKVKAGRDAPAVDVSETRPDGTERWSRRRQTPDEQRQMSLGEAIYKKGVRPLTEKAASFSQKLAQDRNAAKDADRQQHDKAAMLERWKREREKDKERGR
ncbi:MobA/MobL family protein [Bradyrhizobium sp. SZCCHNS2002]|uniref:MobA/MobL family protein n=1 Tax=Bradyrhizobium sp. SZCCHNS2002 TaxID=3057302 RepID=UPI002916D9B6|nr:MobA/MobL family protein [Bradyrhizobium sp. SZCCHNS2002]